jgi:xanthine dehydrogenase molybdenum-binding subunit
MAKEYSLLGKRLPRVDALAKVTGAITFVSDIQLPRMLYTRFLRSPYAHAQIINIDTSKAEILPGVKCVLTHKNVPKIHPLTKFEYLLDETLHYVGEEVAVVAAISNEVAEQAVRLIQVDYNVLPAVFNAEEAMIPDAPLVHPEYGTNMYHGTDRHPAPRCGSDGWLSLEYQDVDKGFTEADYIVEGTFETPKQHPCSPAPRAVLCQWMGEKLTCWTDTQRPLDVQKDLAKCLGLLHSNVKVVSSPQVGGYGGKQPEKIATLTAMLAKRTGAPVKTVFSREEDFIATHRRLDYKTYGKVGVKRDGTITALYTRTITNFGRDSSSGFMVPATSAVNTCSMLYRSENSKWEGCHVMTNVPDHAAMNGFGDPEAGFCVERLMDEAAEKIGMDPVEFRFRNCMRYGDKGLANRNVLTGPIDWGVVGTDIDSFPECIKKAAEKAEWKKKWKGWKIPVSADGSKRRGIGVAIGVHHSENWPYSAIVKMNHDGTASVLSQLIDMGQGSATAMAQVAAETLGLRYEDINLELGDTSVSPAGSPVVASSGTSGGIAAVKCAADDAKRKLFDIAAKRLGVSPNKLAVKERMVYVRGNPEKSIPIAVLCTIGWQITGTGINPPANSVIDKKTGKVIRPVAVVATICEVEVDTETGELNVLRITSAHDCGKAINPQMVENQINMSLTLGNGYVRSEKLIIDGNTGTVLNPNLLDYKVMTFLDMPKMGDIEEIIVEFPCAWGPFGAKGMSETATTTQGPAIANAVYNAVGVRIRGDQLTPQMILEAIVKE